MRRGVSTEVIGRRIGDRLRVLRQAAGLTQEEVAERIEVDASFITKLEAGKRLPSVDTVVRLAGALGVPVARIMEVLDDTRPPADPRLIGEVVKSLRNMSVEQLQYVRRFIQFVIFHERLNDNNTE